MGNELFGTDIAGIIDDVMSDDLLDVVVTRVARGGRTPGNLTGGRAATPQTFEGMAGFWEDFTGPAPPGVTVEVNDRKAVIIGDTIPPGLIIQQKDGITIEGQTLWVHKLLSRDPAAAVYVYHCKDSGGTDPK